MKLCLLIMIMLNCSLLAMTSCGNDQGEDAVETSTVAECESSKEATEAPEESSFEEATKLPELTDAELEEARQVALTYYENTVFDVTSLDVKTTGSNTVKFSVECTKNGQSVATRTIYLKRVDATWEVIEEGY